MSTNQARILLDGYQGSDHASMLAASASPEPETLQLHGGKSGPAWGHSDKEQVPSAKKESPYHQARGGAAEAHRIWLCGRVWGRVRCRQLNCPGATQG